MSRGTTRPRERPTLALLRASRSAADAIGAVTAQVGLTIDQWLLLELLVDHRTTGLSMTQLRELTGLTGPTLTRVVDHLIANALAHREVDPLDRRRVLVHVSVDGAHTYRSSVDSVDYEEAQLAVDSNHAPTLDHTRS